ncbi:MAG: amidohydrolase family protein [Bacteroidales bacterium]|nr:amidohydrolase family protein [Bacteroidales bacterium]
MTAVTIDSLTHVTMDGHWFTTSFDASITRLLREMDIYEVDRAVVVALAGYIENSFVEDICKKYKDKLIPGASINPTEFSNPNEAAAYARGLLCEGRFPVLKLHPRLHKFDVLDSRCLSILDEIAQKKLPVLVWLDTLFRYNGASMSKPPIDSIHKLVGEYSSIKFVLLHSCGSDILRLADAIRDCKNVLLDISYTLGRYKGSSVDLDLSYLFRTFDKRIVFGSDFPEISIGEALADFELLCKGLSLEKKERILGLNLSNLLNNKGF